MKAKLSLILLFSISLITPLLGCNKPNIDKTNLVIKDNKNDGSNEIKTADSNTFGVDIQRETFDPTIKEQASYDEIYNVYQDGEDILDKYQENIYRPLTKSTGTPKFLVVPVLFKGTKINPNFTNEDKIRTTLMKAFFGKDYETSWESVASYYHKSSFNALNIYGEVSHVFNCDYTYGDLLNAKPSQGYYYVEEIVKDVYRHFFGNKIYNVNDFDMDHNGYVDGIYLVYLNDFVENTALWAYKSDIFNREKDIRIRNYTWFSFEFLKDMAKPDSSILIHETGHMLGLSDYYNTYNKKLNFPTGGVDMMDLNVGDHNAFSKYYLGWTVPKVFANDEFEEKTFKLRPASETGDALIVANNFNGTAYDEYLIIEYYTPNDLNEYFVSSIDRDSKEINEPGIMIYHVDARLGIMAYDNQSKYIFTGEYTDRIENDGTIYSYIVASNGKSLDGSKGHSLSGFNLITLMDGGTTYGYNRFEEEAVIANSSNLFIEGDRFSRSYPNFTFNDNEALKYDIKINEINNRFASITVSNKVFAF